MAPPLRKPINYYISWLGDGEWTPASPGMHCDYAALCNNSYGAGYQDIIKQERFAEAVDLIDGRWNLTALYSAANPGDPRHLDPAFNVGRFLYWTSGMSSDECHRPGHPTQNPLGLRDPVHYCYAGDPLFYQQTGHYYWKAPPGYVPLGTPGDSFLQPPSEPTQSQYEAWRLQNEAGLDTRLLSEPSLSSGKVLWHRNTLTKWLNSLGYHGGTDWDSLATAYAHARTGGTWGGGSSGGGDGGSGGGSDPGGSGTGGTLPGWLQQNIPLVIIGFGAFAAVLLLKR